MAAILLLASGLRRALLHNRVLEPSRGISAERFGELMNYSHASLRDDYTVSIAELDTLTTPLRQHPDVFGARLAGAGAGYGGACVALCCPHPASAIADETLVHYNQSGRQGRLPPPRSTANWTG